MRINIFFVFLCFNFSVYTQEMKMIELDTIRQQGYLIIETDNEGKLSDVPPPFLFIPFENMEENLKSSYVKNSQPNYNDLYIPTPYLRYNAELDEMNFFIKKFINPEVKIKLNQQFFSTEFVLEKCKNLYRFKEKIYHFETCFKIIYIDGIWVKLKVPKKNALRISAPYNEARLNKSETYYDYYFLIETKAISYDVFFEDESIERW